MDHETASALLADHSRGRLDPDQRRDVAAHLATCSECRDVAALLPPLQSALEQHGAALFEPHPSGEQLARFALAGDELAAVESAGLDAHVRACPTCAEEVALTRRAGRSAWTRAPQAWAHVTGRQATSPWLRPALALTLIATMALIYPAYLGLVRYPQVRRVAAPPPWSGAVAALTLTGETREGEVAGPGDPIAEVVIRTGQPYLPLLIAYEPPIAAQQSIEVRIARDGMVLWSTTGTLAWLWDRNAEAMMLLAPALGMTAGEYALELRWTAAGPADWHSAFRVVPSQQP